MRNPQRHQGAALLGPRSGTRVLGRGKHEGEGGPAMVAPELHVTTELPHEHAGHVEAET